MFRYSNNVSLCSRQQVDGAEIFHAGWLYAMPNWCVLVFSRSCVRWWPTVCELEGCSTSEMNGTSTPTPACMPPDWSTFATYCLVPVTRASALVGSSGRSFLLCQPDASSAREEMTARLEGLSDSMAVMTFNVHNLILIFNNLMMFVIDWFNINSSLRLSNTLKRLLSYLARCFHCWHIRVIMWRYSWVNKICFQIQYNSIHVLKPKLPRLFQVDFSDTTIADVNISCE